MNLIENTAKSGMPEKSRQQASWTEECCLKTGVLEALTDKALFYPCSGMDFRVPFAVFSPWISDFYFVDKGYFSPMDQDMAGKALGRSIQKIMPVLSRLPEYQLLDIELSGDFSMSAASRKQIPDLMTDSIWSVPVAERVETYLHLPTHRTVRLHFRRDDGVSALLSLERKIDLGVFFYRGDSMGEGGSGVMWLQHRLISWVMSIIANLGLFVTDGSQHDGMGWQQDRGVALGYKDFWLHRNGNCIHGERFSDSEYLFLDQAGRCIKLSGVLGKRYGRTLVWQIYKNRSDQIISPEKYGNNF